MKYRPVIFVLLILCNSLANKLRDHNSLADVCCNLHVSSWRFSRKGKSGFGSAAEKTFLPLNRPQNIVTIVTIVIIP